MIAYVKRPVGLSNSWFKIYRSKVRVRWVNLKVLRNLIWDHVTSHKKYRCVERNGIQLGLIANSRESWEVG